MCGALVGLGGALDATSKVCSAAPFRAVAMPAAASRLARCLSPGTRRCMLLHNTVTMKSAQHWLATVVPSMQWTMYELHARTWCLVALLTACCGVVIADRLHAPTLGCC